MNGQQLKKTGFPTLLVVIGLGIISMFTYLFIEIGEELLETEIKSFDSSIINFLKTIETDNLDQIMIIVTELGSVWFLTSMSILVIILLWFRGKDKWGIAAFVAANAGGALITKILKEFYDRGRPSINPEIDAIGFSFPSGHSMGSFIFYGFVIYLIFRSRRSLHFKWCFSIVSGSLIFLIGFSRIYLGAHYPSDVIAGFLAGATWMLLCILALEWIEWQINYHIRPFHIIRKLFSNTT
ncbi:phosphatase PAP2 family protein [Aquibacillus kalidii]|uniref:phosphatase PAP2 family protein n=1 Tax=Aquibacillus kalidii TaxID=2762597 RepID=UPI001F466109|nr:phosphatase PAP2 family protein [Aquibacillus kalidii]